MLTAIHHFGRVLTILLLSGYSNNSGIRSFSFVEYLNKGRRCIHGESHCGFERPRNILKSLSLRGGDADEITTPIITAPTYLNNEDVDQLVDELIAGVNDGGGDDRMPYSNRSSAGGVAEPEPASDGNRKEMKIRKIIDEQGVDEETDADGAKRKVISHAAAIRRDAHSPNNQPYQFVTSRPIAVFSPPSTPTNAYYRFILRRGPTGHILAAFTLVAVQWVYTFIPSLYGLISYALVKLHIYNPRVLCERDRQQRLRSMGRYSTTTSTRSGLKHKFNFFGKSRQEQQQQQQNQAMLQKHVDEEAASKLKQLYKTMKIGSGLGMLSEVKYRYLSIGFRRKHFLGKEYRIEKPRTFLGEVVMGATRTVGDSSGDGFDSAEDMVFSDNDVVIEGDISAIGSDKPRKGQRQRSQMRGKRILFADWVVDAFSRHRPSTLTNSESQSTHAKLTHDKVSNTVPISSLWTEVDRDAILEAAWASCAADPSVNMKSRKEGVILHDSGKSRSGVGGAFDAASSTGSSGYSASKMFQSVMTRVGSNGRVFGAYPNDAFPIELCAHKRGVLGLARKYGYGDWRTASYNIDEIDDDEEELELWGGNLDDN